MQKTILLLAIILILTASLRAQTKPQPTSPPVFDHTFQGATLRVIVEGTWPTTYQWYRGTATNLKKVKIDGATGSSLVLEPPYVAGHYVCEATNAAGSAISDVWQVSVTKSATAPKTKITLKQP